MVAAAAAQDSNAATLSAAIEEWIVLLEKDDATAAAERWAGGDEAAKALKENWARLRECHEIHRRRPFLRPPPLHLDQNGQGMAHLRRLDVPVRGRSGAPADGEAGQGFATFLRRNGDADYHGARVTGRQFHPRLVMSSDSPTQPALALRILVVDDHEDTAHALTRLLRGEGHYVTTAHSVAGAMALVAGQRPVELLISDIGLPDGDGCELLRGLREFYGGRDIPAIALTGHGDEGLVELCRLAGYRHFLLKPFRFEQVMEALRDLAPAGRARKVPVQAKIPVQAPATE